MQKNHDYGEDMELVLSSDAKPRLKWTPQLHQRFLHALNHLGGQHKATPKSLMRVMGINGLTLYHLKSHLQKYRLGISQEFESNSQLKLEEMQRKEVHSISNSENRADTQNHNTNESKKISEALKMQIEVQRRLEEQIEVQRHLQVRIEAQGKYLQTVLKKAQETIAGYGYCSEAMEQAKTELSQLASSMASSELTELTEVREGRMGSIDSCLTSSEISEEDLVKVNGNGKRKKRKEIEQSSSVSEGDFKRLMMKKNEEFRMIDLNYAQFDEGLELIEYL